MRLIQNIDLVARARHLTRTQQVHSMNGSTESSATVAMIGAEAERRGCTVVIDTSQRAHDIQIDGRLYEVRNLCRPMRITFGPSTGKGMGRPFNEANALEKWRILAETEGGILVVDTRIIFAMRTACMTHGSPLALHSRWASAYRLDPSTQMLEHVYTVVCVPASWVIDTYRRGALPHGALTPTAFDAQFPYARAAFAPGVPSVAGCR
jgi:hypothetical protein